jgi:hypothetical protein
MRYLLRDNEFRNKFSLITALAELTKTKPQLHFFLTPGP